MNKNEQHKLLKIMSIYIILQPFFDILSNLYIDGYLKFQISTFLKPMFVFCIATYTFIRFNNNRKKWILYGIFFLIFMIGHYYILSGIYVEKSVMLHEFRVLLNIIYMTMIYLTYNTIYRRSTDKKYILDNLKKTIIITFSIYCILLIISIITGTSGMTYEYADKLKKGYKGWFDSGQILGHAISIMLPILLYTMLKLRKKWYIRILFLVLITICISLLGTKVPYIIMILVYFAYIFISIFNLIFNKYYKFSLFNLCLVIICLLGVFLTYKYTPVSYNTNLNHSNLSISYDKYNLNDIDGSKDGLKLKELIEKLKKEGKDITELEKYASWSFKSSKYLVKQYKAGKLHPSNTRAKEFAYSSKKYELSTMKYKLFGIGFLNQEDTLALETDFFMAIFAFGIFGFIALLAIPIYEFIKSTKYMFKNIKTNDLETYLLYMGFGIFFCISIYAGYTYIYTNFSIFLIVLIIMLKSKIYDNEIRKKENEKIDTINFLMLHTGYGGIESATINSANVLSKKYKVNLISFYNLKNNQEDRINKNINIIHLYNGEPNRDKFFEYKNDKKYLKMIKEGIIALKILTLKKLYIIDAIKKIKNGAIVSTRSEYTLLMNKYANRKVLTIAQEHRYHNHDKKYIKMLSNRYYNIDYLCALTKTLESDYKEFLKDGGNYYTKVVYLPNMIISDFNKTANLDNQNIITVSRLHPVKKVGDLVKAFSNISNKKAKLLILGDGEEYELIRKEIKKLKLEDRVKLLGYKNQEAIEKYLLKSRVFALTSITEGLPMVLIEAMSYGIPCIAYSIGNGVEDIIDDKKNGYIIKNRDELEYAKALDKLLSSDLKTMSKNAKEKAKTFSENNVIKLWYNILNKKY